ncbi:transcriptional regulator [Actinomadura sp. CNU-125]|uniref:LCP family protein n=1 Tax=Actinomadura sp. CNU-125 TaxID=1904961 RepID=UPI00095A6B92|nr:LCP family protein [Actinomadura sp. CNU-125]OLT38198.1 transcriptional regulator [Actinomadura sp. CNU-125]
MNSNPMYMEYVDDADPEEPAPPRRGWRILGWVCIGLSAVMVLGSLTAYGLYRQAFGNIAHEDVNAKLGPDRPEKLNEAMNILLLGSDTREGANAKYGAQMKNELPRSDTMILLHLSPGGEQAMAISFPRDLMVQRPECEDREGKTVAGSGRVQINSAFTVGGATCVIKTLESMTDIRIDHFVQVDFNGFKNITKAIGGVPVCLNKDVDDKKSGLKLSRGEHEIEGEVALAYVRARYSLGDGTDTSRIKRQQKFLGALASKVMSAGVLTNPKALLSLLNATTESLTTDSELSVTAMRDIAQGMQGLSSGKLRFVTVPNGQDPQDKNRLILSPNADAFFKSVREDKKPPEEEKKKTTGGTPKQAAPTIPPKQIRVRVFNGSGINGQASRVETSLEAQGFQVTVGGNAERTEATKVLYGSGAENQAKSLAALIPSKPTAAAQTGDAQPGVVDLVIGTNWTDLKGGQQGIPEQQGEIRASDDICSET